MAELLHPDGRLDLQSDVTGRDSGGGATGFISERSSSTGASVRLHSQVYTTELL